MNSWIDELNEILLLRVSQAVIVIFGLDALEESWWFGFIASVMGVFWAESRIDRNLASLKEHFDVD